ncbi:MAG: NTPase [Deltaproteobacteria bacterium]|nr:NTPase [Deltaproteobacteria bacterium]
MIEPVNAKKRAMRLFLTGAPGVGKTTLIRAVVEGLEAIKCAGFYTLEERRGGQRVGFRIVTLSGREGSLASLGNRPPTVGRYSVHLDQFEALVLPELDSRTTPADLYVIDEIGKMELFSRKFAGRLVDLLAEPTAILATIAQKGMGLIEQIKNRDDIELIEVSRKNRDRLVDQIRSRIKTERERM